MREIGDIVREYQRRRGESFALATLVRARGSSYRRPGARMLIALDGHSAGSLSGGCLEEEVVERARLVLQKAQPSLLTFDARRRFGCHGSLDILVEKVSNTLLDDLSARFFQRETCWIATNFGDQPGSRLSSHAQSAAEGEFVQLIQPAPSFLVVGGGPDSKALHSFAHALGWKFQLVESAAELIGTYDPWTVAVVQTHNYGRDFAALRQLLPTEIPYVGLIGPRARRDQLIGDLADIGIMTGDNLFAPAGLDLGGESPEQIALAIVAEIQAVLTEGSCRSLRERLAPIHSPRSPRETASV